MSTRPGPGSAPPISSTPSPSRPRLRAPATARFAGAFRLRPLVHDPADVDEAVKAMLSDRDTRDSARDSFQDLPEENHRKHLAAMFSTRMSARRVLSPRRQRDDVAFAVLEPRPFHGTVRCLDHAIDGGPHVAEVDLFERHAL